MDRLEEIKQQQPYGLLDKQSAWLISEVESLRAEVKELEPMRGWLADANKKWFEIDKENDDLRQQVKLLEKLLEDAIERWVFAVKALESKILAGKE